jgi:hypothetical protein
MASSIIERMISWHTSSFSSTYLAAQLVSVISSGTCVDSFTLVFIRPLLPLPPCTPSSPSPPAARKEGHQHDHHFSTEADGDSIDSVSDIATTTAAFSPRAPGVFSMTPGTDKGNRRYPGEPGNIAFGCAEIDVADQFPVPSRCVLGASSSQTSSDSRR